MLKLALPLLVSPSLLTLALMSAQAEQTAVQMCTEAGGGNTGYHCGATELADSSAAAPPQVSDKALLEATYGGSFSSECACVEIQMDGELDKELDYSPEQPAPTVSVAEKFLYRDSLGDWDLILFEIVVDSVHAAPGNLGMALLKWERDGWTIVSFDRFVGHFGDWGSIPATRRLIRIGDSTYGVMLEGMYGGQGYFDGQLDLVGVIGNEFRALGRFPGERDYTGGGGADQYTADYSFRNQGGILYDLYISYEGTRNGADFRSTDRYFYNDDAYELFE